jgi:hypothetical protein
MRLGVLILVCVGLALIWVAVKAEQKSTFLSQKWAKPDG